LSTAYARIARLRRAWYARPGRSRRLPYPVISVGNLSMGGSGKTPVVAALARLLRQRGERPVILTRGYGRLDTREGVLVVSNGQRVLERVEQSGDEPQLLARTLPGVPVLVGADRYLAGAFAGRHFAATVSILDDGFQHVQLERDVDLLLVSVDDLNERVVPAGHLREPLDAAQLADAILVAGSEEDLVAVAEAVKHPTIFRVKSTYEAGVVDRRVQKDPPYTIQQDSADSRVHKDPAYTDRVVAFAGIARPDRFFNALRSLGYEVARELTFPDHHWYTARDIAGIQAAARHANVPLIVTTEKDAVRCDLECAVLPMSVEVEPTAEFERWLMARLRTSNSEAVLPKLRSSEGGW
jgi:tetraacyldisaccharide 4'-kinase